MGRAVTVVFGIWLLVMGSNIAYAEKLVIGGTGSALGLVRLLAAAYTKTHPDISIVVPDSVGSGGGIKAVLKQKFHIGLSSRHLKIQEESQGARAIDFVTTPFVFVVSSRLKAEKNLKKQEIAQIFDRTLTAWPDGTRARAILRPKSDGDTKKFMEIFPDNKPPRVRARNAKGKLIASTRSDGDIGKFSELVPDSETLLGRARKVRGALIAQTDQDAMDLAEQLPGAVTTGSLSAILSEQRALVPLSIDGVAPTLENLKRGHYNFTKQLRFVVGPKMNKAAVDFLAFTRSPEAAEILLTHGGLPVAQTGTN